MQTVGWKWKAVSCGVLLCLAIGGGPVLWATIPALGTGTCPPLERIERVSGTYNWRVLGDTARIWQGYFAAPRRGQGQGYAVRLFSKAEWWQLQDRPDSPGVLRCYYQTEIPGELLSFVQTESSATLRPHHLAWQCVRPAQFPGAACTCSAGVADCNAPAARS